MGDARSNKAVFCKLVPDSHQFAHFRLILSILVALALRHASVAGLDQRTFPSLPECKFSARNLDKLMWIRH